MSTTVDETDVHTRLRFKAEAQLQAGTTTVSHWSMGVDALRLLHRLSSNPDQAEDALKLLHELQVHQVELDLQNEAIAAGEQGLADDLDRYRVLYDSAPVGYLVVDLEGIVIQDNQAAAELFGVGHNELEGQRIDTFVTPQNRPRLLGLLQRVAQSGTREHCLAETVGGAPGSRQVQFIASVSPGGEHILLGCCECANAV